MKQKPWRRKVCAVVLEAGRRYRPQWMWTINLSQSESDFAIVTVIDGERQAQTAINLRAIFKDGKRGNFDGLTAAMVGLTKELYAGSQSRSALGALHASEARDAEPAEPDRAASGEEDAQY